MLMVPQTRVLENGGIIDAQTNRAAAAVYSRVRPRRTFVPAAELCVLGRTLRKEAVDETLDVAGVDHAVAVGVAGA